MGSFMAWHPEDVIGTTTAGKRKETISKRLNPEKKREKTYRIKTNNQEELIRKQNESQHIYTYNPRLRSRCFFFL